MAGKRPKRSLSSAMSAARRGLTSKPCSASLATGSIKRAHSSLPY
ncbi:Uncharacterised protein [Vibrio cholerae]|nr:Uncharacterised protein [Vibrio cholerae]